MKKFLIAACAVSMISGVTVASAAPAVKHDQQTIKSSDTTDISARKKKMKKGMMRGNSGMQGGGMQGGGMQGGGMQGGGMQGGGMQGGGMQGGGMQGGQGNMQKKGGM